MVMHFLVAGQREPARLKLDLCDHSDTSWELYLSVVCRMESYDRIEHLVAIFWRHTHGLS